MDVTPKIQRKSSLSLSTRLNRKRLSASPHNHLKPASSKAALDSNSETLQRSPSVISICSDGGIECTPPHKKIAINFDESLDFSPKMFDSSFSPTCLLSQTLAIDSPEVGWKWSRHSAKNTGADPKYSRKTSIHTPDSAYAADSSFASAGSSSTDIPGNVRIRGDIYKEQTAKDGRKEQRKFFEQELRRVENTKAEEKLKQRCAKLQEQLKCANSLKSKARCELDLASSNNFQSAPNSDIEMTKLTTILSKDVAVKLQTPRKSKNPDLVNDFFNDSDSDCFLLEATQEIESKIEAKTQPHLINISSTSTSTSESSSVTHANSAPAATTTPSNTYSTGRENREKRSSFYMKFLEDDCGDDWFVSLDEAVLQATHNKKSRSSLQRYKSMPVETGTKLNATSSRTDNDYFITDTKIHSSNHAMILSEGTDSSSTLSKMKRHSSTHALSPNNTNYRSRRQL